MSIYRRFPAENLPLFITTNTSKRRLIFTSPSACKLLIRTIYEVRTETHFSLLAITVMPDHLHLLLVPQCSGLGQVVQLIKGRYARAYNQSVGTTGAVWQSRYHEQTLRSETALFKAIAYVHQNPVAAYLVSEAEDYDWSSASGRYELDLDEYLGQAEA